MGQILFNLFNQRFSDVFMGYVVGTGQYWRDVPQVPIFDSSLSYEGLFFYTIKIYSFKSKFTVWLNKRESYKKIL